MLDIYDTIDERRRKWIEGFRFLYEEMKGKQVRPLLSLCDSICALLQASIRQTIHERREECERAQRKLEAAEAAFKKSLSSLSDLCCTVSLSLDRFHGRSDSSVVPNFGERLKELDDARELCRTDQITAKDQYLTVINQFAAEESTTAGRYFAQLIREKQRFYQEIDHLLGEQLLELEESLARYPLAPSFGAPLADHCRRNPHSSSLAYPIETCVHLLQGSLREDGLFRMGPSLVKQKKLVAELDLQMIERKMSDLKALAYDAHVPTAALKQYLRDLPTCLLTGTSMNQWNEVLVSTSEETRLEKATQILQKLPPVNLANLASDSSSPLTFAGLRSV